MADRTIGELPVADHLDDDSLLVVEQQSEARSIQGRLVRQFAENATAEQVAAAAASAQQAQQAAQESQEARDEAQAIRDTIVVDREALQQAVSDAQSAQQAAESSAGAAGDSARLAESWAHGGTGTRPGEDADNAEHWADVAQGYAQQAVATPVQGVYNVVLTDSITQQRYALIVEDGALKLLGVSDSLEATDLTFVDSVTGSAYSLIVEDGTLKIEEVA